MIEGKEFVKASKLAKDFGYTSDYIGQLCRGGKVDAQLIGRSWYVELSSLHSHKDNRYKTTVKNNEPQIGYEVSIKTDDSGDETTDPEVVTESGSSAPVSFIERLRGTPINREANQVTVKTVSVAKETTEDVSTSVRDSKSFYNRVPTPMKPADYATDDTDLIPTFKKEVPDDKKTAKLKIGLADATSVKITSATAKYDFATPKKPKVHFKGSLSLDEIYDPDPIVLPPEENETEKAEMPAAAGKLELVAEEETDRSAVGAVRINRRTEMRPGVVGMRRKGRLNRNPEAGTLEMPPAGAEEYEVRTSGLVVIVATFAALLLVTAALGMERQFVTDASGQVVIETFTFNIDNLLAAVYGSK